jgi:hypothetical protein
MRSQTPNQRTSRALFNFDYESLLLHKSLRDSFNKRDRIQMTSYITDLENSLAINKTIITDLLNTQNQKGLSKEIIHRLNKPPTTKRECVVARVVEKTIKERNHYQTKVLILEQIVLDYKAKEKENETEIAKKAQEYLDELNIKEYTVQKKEVRKSY